MNGEQEAHMKYTGRFRKMYSDVCGEDVSVLEYESDDKFPYCTCTRCGKPIKKKMFVVQSDESGIELMYLGTECIKHFT